LLKEIKNIARQVCFSLYRCVRYFKKLNAERANKLASQKRLEEKEREREILNNAKKIKRIIEYACSEGLSEGDSKALSFWLEQYKNFNTGEAERFNYFISIMVVIKIAEVDGFMSFSENNRRIIEAKQDLKKALESPIVTTSDINKGKSPYRYTWDCGWASIEKYNPYVEQNMPIALSKEFGLARRFAGPLPQTDVVCFNFASEKKIREAKHMQELNRLHKRQDAFINGVYDKFAIVCNELNF